MWLFLINVRSKPEELKLKQSLKLYHVLRDANQLVLNYKRFSYFRLFTHNIITQNTTYSNIMYLYKGHSASTSLRKRKGVDKESNKKCHRKERLQSRKWCPSHKVFYLLFSVTQSLFLLGFSWNSDNITASNKKSTSKKEPTSASEVTIKYLHKNIVIPLLYQCGFFIHTFVCLKI